MAGNTVLTSVKTSVRCSTADKALTSTESEGKKKKKRIVLHQRNSSPNNLSILLTLLQAYHHHMLKTLINLHTSGTCMQAFLLKSSEKGKA